MAREMSFALSPGVVRSRFLDLVVFPQSPPVYTILQLISRAAYLMKSSSRPRRRKSAGAGRSPRTRRFDVLVRDLGERQF